MRITPMDIVQQKFRKVFYGFDPREVEAFMQMIGSEFEILLTENSGLKDEIKMHKRELDGYRDKEGILKETMLTAQRLMDNMKTSAAKEAEIIVAEAEMRADETIGKAHLRAMEMMEEIKELKRQKIQFETSLRALVETHRKLLDASKEDSAGVEDKLKFMAKK